jgi:hypothetical protein
VPGEPRAIIEGGSLAIHLVRAKHLILENLEIRNCSQNGINCDDGGDRGNENAAHDLAFRNLYIHHIGNGGNQDGLKLSGVNQFSVEECHFAEISDGGSGIDMVGCHEGRITSSWFKDMGSNSVQVKGGTSDIEIRGCRFERGGSRAINIGGSTGFAYFRPPLSSEATNYESRGIRVLANLFTGSDAPVAFVGTTDSLVANNTMIDPERWIIRILQETVSTGDYVFGACGNNQFVNNLVYYSREKVSIAVNIGPNTDAGSFGFSNNLWYAHDRPDHSAPRLPADEDGGIAGRAPLFDPQAGQPYVLQKGSPALGAGKWLEGVLADDIEGRRFADPPSIGAYEVQKAGESPAAGFWALTGLLESDQ